MAQPTPYARAYSFTSFQGSSPSTPLPGTRVDTEFDAVANTIDQVLENLALIQRDDGGLANEIVSVASLSSPVKTLMASGVTIRGAWVTGTSYTAGDIVEESGLAYFCMVDHVAGTFATDFAADKWVLLFGLTPGDDTVTTAKIVDGAVTFAKMQDITSDRLLGRDTASSGDVEEISLDSTLEFTGAGAVRRAALTGDVTASAGSNATTIANDAVSYAKMQNVSAASRLLGRGSAAGAGDPEEITVGGGVEFNATAIQRSALTGDVTASAGSGATTVANNAVTFAKMQDITSDRLLGRDTASSGDPEELTVGGGLEFTGSGGIRRSALSGDVTAAAGSGTTAIGFPAWSTTTPTPTPGSGAFTTVSCVVAYLIRGKWATFNCVVTITTNGTAGGSTSVTMPFTAKRTTGFGGKETSAVGVNAGGYMLASSASLVITKYDATYLGGNGYVISVSGELEIE